MRSLLTALLFISQFLYSQPAGVQEWIKKNQPALLSNYMQFLALPNVMGDSINIARNANFIAGLMKEAGINTTVFTLNIQRSSPLVYGEVITPGATTTLGLYAHYDGQPVNAAQWANGFDPFTPVVVTDRIDRNYERIEIAGLTEKMLSTARIYARGSSDDKAGVFAIINAYRALKATGEKLKVNLKFMFEGEEEAGSINLGKYFEAHADKLRADLYVICDGPKHISGKPQLVFGVRGDVNADLTVYSSLRPLHSGNYGNWAPNAAMRLVELLAAMKDEKGMVSIPGFYDDAIPLTPAEMQAIKNIPDVVPALSDELAMPNPDGDGRSYQELLNIPTLNINGISAANTGAMASNIIPAEAKAVLDLRLVKGNTIEGQFNKIKRFIEQQGYTVLPSAPTREQRSKYPLLATLTLRNGGYPAQKTDMQLPVAQKVIAALQSAEKTEVLRIPTAGGSLPLYLFENILKSPPVSLGIVNFDNNQHAENENVRIDYLLKGIATMAAVMMIQ